MLTLIDEITPLTSADLARALQLAGREWLSVEIYIVDGDQLLRVDSLHPSATQHALTSDAVVRQTSEALDVRVSRWRHSGAGAPVLIIDATSGSVRLGLPTRETRAHSIALGDKQH